MPLQPRSPGSLIDRLADQIANRRYITPHFERALLAEDWPEEYEIRVYNKEREYDGYFHPSSDASMGALQLYYKHHPSWRPALHTERVGPGVVMTAQIGSAIHSVVQSLWIMQGFVEKEDVEVKFVNEERHCAGAIDAAKFHTPDGDFCVDIKTKNTVPKAPDDKHVAQLQVYMDAGMIAAYGEPAERGILYYIARSYPHPMKEFVIERSESMLADIYGRWSDVRAAIAANDPSGLRDCCNRNTAKHRECPARDICRIGPPTL